MRKAIVSSIMVLSTLGILAQSKIEAQTGGANYLGLTINYEFEIRISQTGDHRVLPSFGMGFMLPSFAPNTFVVHTGLNYAYKKWGLGMEASGFTDNPFWGTNNSMFVDLMIYPNFNYTLSLKSNIYIKFSAGAFIGFDEVMTNDLLGSYYEYVGDAMPGAGISIGYEFRKRP